MTRTACLDSTCVVTEMGISGLFLFFPHPYVCSFGTPVCCDFLVSNASHVFRTKI